MKSFPRNIKPVRVLKHQTQMTGFMRSLTTLYYYGLTLVSGFKTVIIKMYLTYSESKLR
jgi:hypothetical protein